jgi:serine/threonine-protein kinase
MTNCLRDQSRRYLAGVLNAAEESAFVEHLDSCASCQHWMEEEAGGAAEWRMAKEVLASSCATETRAQQAIEQIRPPRDIAARSYPELAYLHPSDDPAMLGRIGSLEVIGVLGRGGMGVVFKCFDPALRRNVAVKLLDPVLANHGAARQRFAREARAMAAISHEHVVPIYAVDEHAELPYLVMEYVPGGTLERRLLQDGPLDVIEVTRVGLQVAAALAAAHRQGLVHRDIKPSNILLDQGTERVRVADFGLARAANDATFTRSGTLAGTPLYMAPEQVRGEACDAQSDLFSLGCLIYTLCVGHPPFRGDSVYAVMQRIVHDEPRSLREQNANTPTWLEEFVFRLLAKEKSARFTTADEVVAILESELAYQQSPHAEAEPARGWRRAHRVPKPMLPLHGRRRVTRAAAALAVISGLWLASTWAPGPEGKQEDGSAHRHISDDEPTVPSWDSDGMREIQAAARSLEERTWQTAIESEFDPWQHQANEIRQRLAHAAAAEDLWVSEPY